jgi:hypothetical protein
MLFQIHVDNAAAANQPPLVKAGDQLNFGPYKVGAFHIIHRNAVDPTTGQKVNVDASILEIINTDTGAKTLLPFRRQVKLTLGITT